MWRWGLEPSSCTPEAPHALDLAPPVQCRLVETPGFRPAEASLGVERVESPTLPRTLGLRFLGGIQKLHFCHTHQGLFCSRPTWGLALSPQGPGGRVAAEGLSPELLHLVA